MSRRAAFLVLLIPLVNGLPSPLPALARPGRTAPATLLPRPGLVLLRPSLAELRPLVGRVIRITLTNGKQISARLDSVWPGALQLTFVDGQSGAVARHRIRSVTHLGARFTPLTAQNDADSGRLFFQLGLGLTLGGLVVGGAAAPPLFVVGNKQACPGTLDCVPPATTAAIFVTTLSVSALVAGVPLWVVGAVRRSVHGRVGPAARRARRRYRSWGMGLTFTGAGLAVLGTTLLGVGAANPAQLGALRWAGVSTGTLGLFVALCVGLPMWMEAIREGSAQASDAGAHTTDTTRDPHHRIVGSTLLASPPRGLYLSFTRRF